MKEYIGIFDSGLGGITTIKELIRQLPDENVVFFADTANVPYGSKTKKEICVLARANVEFLKQYNLKALVVACNTVASNAMDVIEIDVPVYNVIEPAALKAVNTTQNKKVGLIATTLTVNSKRYDEVINRIDSDIKVYSNEAPKLVPLIEAGKFDSDNEEMNEAIREYVKPLINEGIDTLILGCTHYDVLIDAIEKMYPELNIVSSSRCVIDNLKDYLDKNNLHSNEKERLYFVSGNPDEFKITASKIIKDIETRQK